MTILTAILIATVFVLWPILGKYSQAGGGWVGTLVLLTTGISISFFSRADLANSSLSFKSFLILAIAGVLNGIGCYLYASKTSSSEINTAVFITLVSVLMVLITPVLSWLINNETFETRHFFGFGCAIITIYLLR